jgi:hypothetical protein
MTDSDGESGLIQDGTQVVDSVENDMGDVLGESLCELHLEDICDAITIYLRDYGPWLLTRERANFPFEFGNPTPCPVQHSFRTIE